jgi:hypothetical protein
MMVVGCDYRAYDTGVPAETALAVDFHANFRKEIHSHRTASDPSQRVKSRDVISHEPRRPTTSNAKTGGST